MGGKGKGKGGPPPPKAQSAEQQQKAKQEAQQKREQEIIERREANEKEKADREARQALQTRLPTMRGYNIFGTIPWSSAQLTVKVAGSHQTSEMSQLTSWNEQSNGVLVVDLGGEQVVCVRDVKEIVEEFMAESVAVALKMPIARSRIVRPDEAEFQEIEAMKLRCAPLIGFNSFMQEVSNPEAPFMVRVREGSQEAWEKMVLMMGERRSVAILEFVQGVGLDSPGSAQVLLSTSEDIWIEMGRLCALDVVLNNMDRLPLPVFDNRQGNVSNILVTPTTAVGIDQQVNVIVDDKGVETYLSRVQSLVQQVVMMDSTDADVAGTSQSLSPVIARIREAGVTMQDPDAALLLQGMKSGFLEVGHSWSSGALPAILDAKQVEAARLIVASQRLWQDGTWSSPVINSSFSTDAANSCAGFMRKIAATISETVEQQTLGDSGK